MIGAGSDWTGGGAWLNKHPFYEPAGGGAKLGSINQGFGFEL